MQHIGTLQEKVVNFLIIHHKSSKKTDKKMEKYLHRLLWYIFQDWILRIDRTNSKYNFLPKMINVPASWRIFKFKLTYVIHIWLISWAQEDLFLCCVVELKAALLIASFDKNNSVLSSSNSLTFMIPSTSPPTFRTINAFIVNVTARHRI